MITKDITLIKLIQEYPEAAAKLKEMGMSCAVCMGAASETLEDGIKAHGLNLEETLKILNEVLKKDEE
ncbi:MAG: DUF1858 domain-containing protein [Clostridia bacterium]|nr:DUF1858 domain-containing protein [Clostridia bacterium]